jgi:hypothetical protein
MRLFVQLARPFALQRAANQYLNWIAPGEKR